MNRAPGKKRSPRQARRQAAKSPVPTGGKLARKASSTPPEGTAPHGRVFPVEVDPKAIEESLARLRESLDRWAKKGRYTKVRFKFRGKQLLPDLPLAAVVAAEGLTFYWGGLLRALVFNLAGKTLFDVELVNDSEKQLARGKEALLSGELEKALEAFRAAVSMDVDNPRAHLNLGIAYRLKGETALARQALEQARALGAGTPVEAESERLLAQMK